MKKTGIEIIATERSRQIEQEGWSFNHDDTHTDEELVYAAICYAIPHDQYGEATSMGKYGVSEVCVERDWLWPWDRKWWKPTPEDRIKELAKAGALIAAEIDRLNRQLK